MELILFAIMHMFLVCSLIAWQIILYQCRKRIRCKKFLLIGERQELRKTECIEKFLLGIVCVLSVSLIALSCLFIRDLYGYKDASSRTNYTLLTEKDTYKQVSIMRICERQGN